MIRCAIVTNTASSLLASMEAIFYLAKQFIAEVQLLSHCRHCKSLKGSTTILPQTTSMISRTSFHNGGLSPIQNISYCRTLKRQASYN